MFHRDFCKELVACQGESRIIRIDDCAAALAAYEANLQQCSHSCYHPFWCIRKQAVGRTMNLARSASCCATCLRSTACVYSLLKVRLVMDTSSSTILKKYARCVRMRLMSRLTTCPEHAHSYACHTPCRRQCLPYSCNCKGNRMHSMITSDLLPCLACTCTCIMPLLCRLNSPLALSAAGWHCTAQ